LSYFDNPRARTVVDRTAQLWQLTPINYETVRAKQLRRTTTGVPRSVSSAITILTKDLHSQKTRDEKSGRKPTGKP
jgi:hypothetical protein